LFDSSPGWAALWFVVSIVTGSIASFIWRRIMKRWKR
jgi:hypothetical protein